MLTDILSAIPKIFTAAIILLVAYVLGKIIGELVTNLLTGIGFNNVFAWLGLQATSAPRETTAPAEPSETSATALPTKTPSEIAGVVVLGAILLVFLIPATDVLQFQPLTSVITELLRIFGQVLVGVLVFAVGLYLANLAFTILSSSGGSQTRAQAARVSIIALVTAMALQQMGIATSIVNLAFGLLFGAVAVALAVAFGFGSMDIGSKSASG